MTANKRQKISESNNYINNATSEDDFSDLDDSIQLMKTTVKYTDDNMYLDTINKKVLNFDLPLICSSSLASTNIHICLICNKYLQGSSTISPAYRHAVDLNHHVFINVDTLKFIILPEQLILSDKRSNELKDIQLLLKPIFDKAMISQLDTNPFSSETLSHANYDVGYVSLSDDLTDIDNNYNNKKTVTKTHNTLYYSLSHLSELRNYLLEYDSSNDSTPLTNELSKLVSKIWSKYLFKNIVSSLSIENYISTSNKTRMSDPRIFYSWLICALSKENKFIKELFTGKLLTDSAKSIKFTMISIKLPQQSVFKDGTSSSIKQYDLFKLIKDKKLNIKRYPKYLTIFIDRTNDLKLEGIEQELNLNVVKFNPNLLKLNGTEYRLISNITYDNKVMILDKSRDRWIEFDGSKCKEIEKELIFISKSQLQFWELV